MSQPHVPNNCVSRLETVLETDDQFSEALDRLRNSKEFGTVIFFDLVGSTAYRRVHGAETGLTKAFVHNSLVSRHIRRHEGWVVKWTGDGVIGCFSGQEQTHHSYRAFLAATDALEEISERNHSIPAERNFEEIHTKVSICAGAFHYIVVNQTTAESAQSKGDDAPQQTETEPREENDETQGLVNEHGANAEAEAVEQGVDDNDERSAHRLLPVLDPIGTRVDLASRLEALAQPDTILIDEDTFFGGPVKADPHENRNDKLPGIFPVEGDYKGKLSWTELIPAGLRTTVYIPRTAAFCLGETGLVFLRRIKEGKATPQELTDEILNDDAGNGHGGSRVVHVSDPISCNIRGFKAPVNVVAVSFVPQIAPIKHVTYDDVIDGVFELLHEAESSFRAGEPVDSLIKKYNHVVQKDPRNFKANVRLAMLYRSKVRAGSDLDFQTAMSHWQRAKESNKDVAIVWALAGMTHLDDSILELGGTDPLSRAITGFSRAKKLAGDSLDGLLEQYCTCLLATTYFLRKKGDNDYNEGHTCLGEFDNWTPKSRLVELLKKIAEGFRFFASGSDREKAKSIFAEILNQIENGNYVPDRSNDVTFDSLFTKNDLGDLVKKGLFLVDRSR